MSGDVKNDEPRESPTIAAWLKLPADEQGRRGQQLNPYYRPTWMFMKAVEERFVAEFADQPGVGEVFCGFVGTLGPLTGIAVTIRKGQPRTRLPKVYLGFPVVRRYESAGGR